MHTILVVDDDRQLLLNINDELKTSLRSAQIVLAEHGAKASACLSSLPIDLVVTDLDMPLLDGYELLENMAVHHPHVPTIVMLPAENAEYAEKKLKPYAVAQTIQKPFALPELSTMLVRELKSASTGRLTGFRLPAVLEMIEKERRTCTLAVKHRRKTGLFYFRDGKLLDAETDAINGLEAAVIMAGWGVSDITIVPRCRKREQVILRSASSIITKVRNAMPKPDAKKHSATASERRGAGRERRNNANTAVSAAIAKSGRDRRSGDRRNKK
jgi:CheY-like chemotaxis protein